MSHSIIPISINHNLPIDRAIDDAPEAREAHPLPSPVSPLPQTASPQLRPNWLWAQRSVPRGPEERSAYYLKQAESCAQELAKYPPFSQQWNKWLIEVDLHLIDAKRAAQESEKPSFDIGRARQIVLPIYMILMQEAERLADHAVKSDNLFAAKEEIKNASLYLLYAQTFVDRVEMPPMDDLQTRTSVSKTIDGLRRIAEQFAVKGSPEIVSFLLERAGLVARWFHHPFDYDYYADTLFPLAKRNRSVQGDAALTAEKRQFLNSSRGSPSPIISDLDIF